MTYRGRVTNGVIVLAADAAGLIEGTVVDVIPVASGPNGEPHPGTAAAVLRHAEIWETLRDDVDRELQDLRAAKIAEAEAEARQQRTGSGESLDV